MPNLSVNVVMYAKLAGGKRRYRRPATSPDGRLKLWYAVVDGQPEYHPEALYYLQYREHGVLKYDRLPPDPAAMLAAERRKQQILELSAEGLVVLGPAPVALTDPMRPSKDIAAAAAARATSVASGPSARARIDEFLAETAKRRKPKTYDAYASALKPFGEYLAKCNRTSLDAVTREDILTHLDALREERGNGPCTVRKQYDTLKRLYTHYAIAWPCLKKDAPRFTKKRVTVYKERELQLLFEAATREERELFQFFLFTGGREQDVMYTSWSDIDWEDGLYLIQEKEVLRKHLSRDPLEPRGREIWNPKDREEAGIPIPDALLDLLRARRERYPATRWIFPGTNGQPEGHFLRKLKQLALRAGLNCGECYGTRDKKPGRCDRHAICRRWTLHKFRRTFATMHHRAGVDVRTIQHWLRHSDLETTLRYLTAIEYTDKETRSKVNATFARLLTKPAALAPAS